MTKGERIKHRREQLGISQTELAECIGTSKQNLYKYENDIITNIPSDRVEALAKRLNTSPAYIMGWNEGDSLPSSIQPSPSVPERNHKMTLKNKLGITDPAELAREEERISKTKALQLFETGLLNTFEVGTFQGLASIHHYLFSEIYDFAGQVRTVNIAKGNFRFAPIMYLESALQHIDQMPQSNFDEIIEKYVEMNVAHPFQEGNGRSTRIWLDAIFKKEIGQVVDWSQVDKEDYLLAMERSPIKDIEIKYLLRNALTDQIDDREVYMKGIDASYHYEGYYVFKTEELKG